MNDGPIDSLEALEEALDQNNLAILEPLAALSTYWNKSLRVNQKIEIYLKDQGLTEDFKEVVGIRTRKKASELLDTETLELSEKTQKAQELLKKDLDVEIQLQKGSLTAYEEVSYESSASFFQGSVKTLMGLGLSVMLLGPMFQMNLQQLSHAAIPKISKNWQIVPEGKFKDPIISESIKDVLGELSKFNDPTIDDVAQKIIGLNLEDVGEESEEDFEEIASIERAATIDKIERLINSYYHRKVPNAHLLAEKIFDEAKERALDYHILLGIIKTESDFRQDVVSSTGDVSMVQINYRIWSREFLRLELESSKISKEDFQKISVVNEKLIAFSALPKKEQDRASMVLEKQAQGKKLGASEKALLKKMLTSEEKEYYTEVVTKRGLLDMNQLKKDPYYAIEKMADILDVLQKRHRGDKNWFARYHSSTWDLKAGYASKVKRNIAHMDRVNVEHLQEQIEALKVDLQKLSSSHGIDGEKVARFNSSLEKFLVSKAPTKDTGRKIASNP